MWKLEVYTSLSFVFVCPCFFLSFIFNLAAKNSRVKADYLTYPSVGENMSP